MKVIILVLTLQVSKVLLLPYQMFMPQPNQDQMLQMWQDQLMQQQLQRMQMNPYEMDYRMQWPQPQPIPILIFPMNNKMHDDVNSYNTLKNNKDQDDNNHQYESNNSIEETEDAVIIDAKPETNNLQAQEVLIATPYQGKYILGQIIMAIPFLPFEVNVPDTVSWAWNGISSIFGGIGQRWPFNRPSQNQGTQEEANEVATRLLYKHLLKSPAKNQSPMMPLFVVPLNSVPMVQTNNVID